MSDYISLNEVLVKTHYLTQITKFDNTDLDKPIGYGSGFIVEVSGNRFFVTADHTIHLDDYGGKVEQRTWNEYRISVFNNYTKPDNFLSTLVTPLGGFYYMEKLNLNRPKDIPAPIDLTVCKMKSSHFEYPFLTDCVNFANGERIKKGEAKFVIKEESFCEPNHEHKYYIYGKIHTNLIDNIRLDYKNTLKESLTFNSKAGDFLLFNTIDEIDNKNEWEGLSGSPVLNTTGECVGVLCDVLEKSRSIWVMPISTVRMFIDVILQQEQILENNNLTS